MSILLALLFLTLMGFEVVNLGRQRLFKDLAVVLVIYLLTMIPAIMLVNGSDQVPAVNTAIRELFQRILGK